MLMQWPPMPERMLSLSWWRRYSVIVKALLILLLNHLTESHAGDAAMNISKGIPVGRPPTIDIRNAHLSYVITWYATTLYRAHYSSQHHWRFSLSAMTSFMFFRMLKNRKQYATRNLPRVSKPLRMKDWRWFWCWPFDSRMWLLQLGIVNASWVCN